MCRPEAGLAGLLGRLNRCIKLYRQRKRHADDKLGMLTLELSGQGRPIFGAGGAQLLLGEEVDALRLLAQGADDAALAYGLRISYERAVKLRADLQRRLGSSDPVAIAAIAAAHGIR
jgi:DNA-binding CsgD family transcriptional regulator